MRERVVCVTLYGKPFVAKLRKILGHNGDKVLNNGDKVLNNGDNWMTTHNNKTASRCPFFAATKTKS